MRVAVVGAGSFGGWTALHLRNLGADVVLIDSAGPGNGLSSSGGRTRVIRAIYGSDRIYVEMVKRAYEQWDKIGAGLKDPIYTPTGALWMHRGDDGYVKSALPILHDFGFVVDQFTVAEAKKKYPQIDFGGVKSVYLERKAGALSAARACGVVRDAFVKAGGTYRTAHVEPGQIAGGTLSGLQLKDGSRVQADIYVFACGPWLGRIFPALADWVRPTRQEIHYFEVPKGSKQYSPGQLPIWIDFGERIVYGIPAIDGKWFKVADDTRGPRVDGPGEQREPTAEGVERDRKFLAERFPKLAKAPLAATEFCQYENSPDGNLIIDRLPNTKNVWVVGGGSGHGFKLSPVVGEMTAQQIVLGKDAPPTFRLNPARDKPKIETQFERKKSS